MAKWLIANGDGSYSPYGYESNIGSKSNLPYPDYPITNNINQVNTDLSNLFKYKDYVKTDTYTVNERSIVTNLDLYGIPGYTPISCSWITVNRNSIDLVPLIENVNNATFLVVHNISGSAITSSVTRTYRVWFVKASFIKSET